MMRSIKSETSIIDVASSNYSLVPDPVHSFVRIKHPRLTQEAVFIIFSIEGRRIQTIKGKRNSSETTIATNHLSVGNYIIRTENYSKVIAFHFMKFSSQAV
jgi:hypothetical protein